MSWRRLRTDFRFAIIVLFASVAVLAIVPFGVYRVLQGQWAVAAVDAAIVGFLAVSLVHAWRGGDIDRMAPWLVAGYTTGCIAIAVLLGLPGVMWMYPVILANFMLLHWRGAVFASSLGVLALLLIPGTFESYTHVVLFTITAGLAGTLASIFAYRTESQRAQLESLASLDPLTGAFNRRTLEAELAIAIADAQRRRTSCGLAMLDLDHFKRVNDRYGHEAGDQVLVEFTALVDRAIRAGDRLFRFGGEEFVLLMPGVDPPTLRERCEELRERVADGLDVGGSPVTVSIGAAALSPGETAQSWLARADAAVYEAKRRGRDHVVVDAAQALHVARPAHEDARPA
jgi:diguanylate cyclase (GGDEF)-like protein